MHVAAATQFHFPSDITAFQRTFGDYVCRIIRLSSIHLEPDIEQSNLILLLAMK